MANNEILLGTRTFRKIREDNAYIDKTGFIKEFLSGPRAEVSLITRPRRFGKSLLLNMLMEFFDRTKDSRKLFDGLAVSKDKELCAKWMNKYPVIYLSLNEMKEDSFDTCYNRFKQITGRLCEDYDYLLHSSKVIESTKYIINKIQRRSADYDEIIDIIITLCRAIYHDCGIKPIILIDEYDAPLEKIKGEEDYNKMTSFIGNIFETGLKCNDYFEFAILTGCLRISKESIFTGLNNFTCYGVNDEEFADKFGFTHEEVRSLLAEKGLSEKIGPLREWYDGYCFGNNQSVFCPWDVMQYVSTLQRYPNTEPQAYWLNSSGNDIVRKFIDKINVLHVGKELATLLQGGTVTEHCYGSMTYRNFYDTQNFWTDLYFKGYLTKIPQEKQGNPFKPIELRIPNRDVYYIFREEMASWFRRLALNSGVIASLVNEALWNGDEKTVAQLVSELVSNTNCHDGIHTGKEDFCHAFMLGLFSTQQYELFSNIESGTALPDILIDDREHNRAMVIEIRHTDDTTDLEKRAEEALTQSQERQYTAPLLASKRTVLTWGLAFCPKQCLAKCGQTG